MQRLPHLVALNMVELHIGGHVMAGLEMTLAIGLHLLWGQAEGDQLA